MEIDLDRTGDPDSKAVRGSYVMGGMSRTNDGLRRDATDVEAIATHQLSFDQGDLRAHTGGAGGRNESGGASAEHNQIVSPAGGGVLPLRRVDVLHQQSVVLVVRLEIQLWVDHR